MKKIDELIELDLQIRNKYENIEDCPEEEYEEFRMARDNFINETGLTHSELALLMNLKEYGLTMAVNSLIYRIIDNLHKKGKKPGDGVKYCDFDYSQIHEIIFI